MALPTPFRSGPPGPPHTAASPLAAALSRLALVPSPKPWLAYALALLATALATALRWWLGRLVGQDLPPFITYYPLVMLVALFGGTGPGLLTTALAVLAVNFLFLAPTASLAVAQPADQVALALFLAINLALSFVCGALRSARHRTFAEARRAEASEERFRLFMDHTPTLAWIKDDHGRYTYINKAYEQRFGHTLPQCLGKTDADLWPPEVAARLQKADQAALTAGHPIELTEEATEPNGAVSFWLNTKFPVRDAAGRQFIASIGLDITPRKHAEDALRQREAILRRVLSIDTVGTFFFTLDGRITDPNEALLRMCGYSREELSRADWHLLTPPEFQEITQRSAQRIAATGQTPPYEKQWIRKDGSRFWGLFAPTRIAGAGPDSKCVEFVIDITDRKRFQEAVQESETRLRLAVETAELGTYERDLVTNQITLNPACQAILGAAAPFPPDLAPRSLHPEDRKRVLAEAARAFDPKLRAICSAEFRILRPDGTVRWVAGRGRVLFNDHAHPPQPTRFLGVLNDITERKHYEESLLRTEARLTQAIRVARLGTFEHDHLRDTLELSPELRDIYGFAPNEPATLPAILQRLSPDQRQALAAAIQRAHDPAGDGLFEAEHHILIPGREPRWMSVRSQTFFAGDPPHRHPVRTIGAVLDITPQKDHAAALSRLVRERTAKLQETVTELEHFSYTITHDMRAPLRAIAGYTSILTTLLAPSLPDRGRDLLRRISESAVRMDQLITDALQYSRVVRDRPELQPLDPAAAIRGLLEAYPQFQPPHARITLQPEMPRVLANPAAFTQVFSNLLGNAVKFVPPGQVPQITVTAEVRTAEPPPSGASSLASLEGEGRAEEAPPSTPPPIHPSHPVVRIAVVDNGIGIHPEYHATVWQMFQRLSKDYEGTGIGLALVRKVVERMGGRVGLESAPGQGSRFWVELQKAP